MYRIAKREHHNQQAVARGSPEETRIILNEIDKINVAFGYKQHEKPHSRQSVAQSNANSYFYPVPIGVDYNIRRPPYYRLPIAEKDNYGRSRQLVYEVRPRENARLERNERLRGLLRDIREVIVREEPTNLNKPAVGNEAEIIETISNLLPGPSQAEVEDVYDSLNESNEASNEVGDEEGEEDEVEEEYDEGTTLDPPLLNDKFLHHEFLQKQKPKTQERGFNFNTTFIKDLTEKFSKPQTTISPDSDETPLKEKPLEDYDENDPDDTEPDAEIEGIKAPWSAYLPGGPNSQRDILRGGGLIIQRLRVRNGSIAVAGMTHTFFTRVNSPRVLTFNLNNLLFFFQIFRTWRCSYCWKWRNRNCWTRRSCHYPSQKSDNRRARSSSL